MKHRHIHAPEVLEAGASDEEKEKRRIAKMVESEEEEEEDELSDEEIDRRRQTLRQKVLNRNEEEEVCFESCFSCDVLLILPKAVSTVSVLLCRRWKYWTKRRKVCHLKRAHLSRQNTRSTLVGEKINLLHLI